MYNLYLCKQEQNIGYGTYDSFVYCGDSIKEAQFTHPSELYLPEFIYWDTFSKQWIRLFRDTWEVYNDDEWTDPEFVSAEFIGLATYGLKKGIVLSSYNAG